MTTLQLEISDNKLDELFYLLKKINIKPKVIKKEKDLVSFFRNAPLEGVDLNRDKEIYKDRVKF